MSVTAQQRVQIKALAVIAERQLRQADSAKRCGRPQAQQTHRDFASLCSIMAFDVAQQKAPVAAGALSLAGGAAC